MKKKVMCLLWAAVLLGSLWGCSRDPETVETTLPTEETEVTVSPTVPQDGNPEDVTCKGSYTGDTDADTIVATVGTTTLTNRQLRAWYWAEATQFRQTQPEAAPDFSLPLDTQVCTIDDSVGSWQQYFLKQALNRWHSAAALELQSQEDGQPTDNSYKPNLSHHETYMTGIPATSVLYGYNSPFRPNSMHQAYLDEIPALLDTLAQDSGFADAAQMAQTAFGTDAQALEEFVRLYNFGYFYFTQLGYEIDPTADAVEQQFLSRAAAYADCGITRDSGYTVDIRHILLTPEAGEDSDNFLARAEKMLDKWSRKYTKSEATFAEMANKNSLDTGSAVTGGIYRSLQQGQLPETLDAWCFAPERTAGDFTLLTTDQGCHLLYFSGKTENWYAQAEADLITLEQQRCIADARERFPAQIQYEDIFLTDAQAAVSSQDVLYPDVAHQRFPEVPLYLQQDYPGTMYGGYELRTHGCGITTMSMLSTYMTDEEWIPPEMCALYGRYCHHNGTDGMIFINEPPAMGFFLREKTHEPPIAKQALEDGYIVLSLQHKGYWTGGGHYLLLEKITEDDMVQVRDSNIFNYGKLPGHDVDQHTWKSIVAAGAGYWIFEPKVTEIPACTRCGEPEQTNTPVTDYICEKCTPALLRRSAWLEAA